MLTNKSTDLAPHTSLHWFALKVFYNKVFQIQDIINERGLTTYLPTEKVTARRPDGTPYQVVKPIIGSLLFFQATLKQAGQLQCDLTDRVMLYTRIVDCRRVPLVIPHRQMNIFMLVSSSGEKGLEPMEIDSTRYQKGVHVRVIDGPFKGAEGYICRIKKNRRLIVALEGVCAIATSYIPQEFLQVIDRPA